MRILVHTPLGTTGGYARDGVGLIDALLKRDHVVDLLPGSVLPPLPPQIAQLFTYPITDGYDLELHHVPPTGALDFPKGRAKKTVLWTMWEWDNFPSEVPLREAASNMGNYDQVVAYTQQSSDAFLGAGFIQEPATIQQGGIDPTPWNPVTEPVNAGYMEMFPPRKNLRGTFRFAMVGVLGSRKNPWTVLTAFNELKEELGDGFDAELLLKTGFPVVPPNYDAPGVKLVRETQWTEIQMKQFYWSIDCLINVSWGEGKDLPGLEATLCHVPTILNDTPGHKGWVHPGIQKLLPTTPMSLDGRYQGLFTSKDDIKAAMLDKYHRRAVAYTQAEQLASYVRRRATWDFRVEQLGKKIGVPL